MLDLTRVRLAECAGCSVSALRKIESDERRPSRQLAGLLATCLQIPPDQHSEFIQVARGQQLVERLSATPHGEDSRPVQTLPPEPPTPLIGREAELAALEQLLADPYCRLLTLVGPGGIGKTRLALAIVTRQIGHFADGVCYISLASLASPQFIVPTIATALSLTLSGQLEPQNQLINYLRSKSLLLVFDNFEHLLESSGLLVTIIQQAPQVKLLVTSRERLALHSEWVFDLQGLLVPPPGQTNEMETYSAVALFVQSAQRAWNNFCLTEENQPEVASVCRLLDGIPLALELAAAWVRVLSCTEILAEIERSLDFLTTSMRDIPPRQRSLRATFDYSWNLLSVEEQGVLSRLSIFQGGFEREAAESLCGATLPLLLALVSKSLLRREGSGRFDLHELIRQYCREHLRASSAEAAARRVHAQYFLALVQQAKTQMYTHQAPFWLNRLEQEVDNLRAVLDWAVESNGETLAEERITIGLRVAGAMGDFWFVRGYHHEGLARFQELLARPEANRPTAARMRVLIWTGYLLWTFGRLPEAQAVLEEALQVNKVANDQECLAMALENLGRVKGSQGDYAAAQAILEQSLAIWRDLEAGFQMAFVLSELGDIALQQQAYPQAEEYYFRGIAPEVGEPEQMQFAYPYRRLAYLYLRRGDCAGAVQFCRESLQLNLTIHDRRAVAACLILFGSVLRTVDRPAAAAKLFGAAEAILSAIAAPLLPADQREYEYHCANLGAQLSAAEMEANRAAGGAMCMEEAVAFALKTTATI